MPVFAARSLRLGLPGCVNRRSEKWGVPMRPPAKNHDSHPPNALASKVTRLEGRRAFWPVVSVSTIRKAKFAAVGFTSLCVSFLSLYLFIDVLQWNRVLSYALQTILALEVNYVLNNAYTWGDRAAGKTRGNAGGATT